MDVGEAIQGIEDGASLVRWDTMVDVANGSRGVVHAPILPKGANIV